MKIEFVDLKRQNQLYFTTYQKIITETIATADFIQGKALHDFEKQFAAFCGKQYCIGLNSGTDALLFALLAYGIGPGDEVITAPNSYFSTAMVVEHVGAKVVFADIHPETYTIDPIEVAKKINSRTRAIIPIHLYGQPADMEPLLKLARKHHLHIIEDACQAHGAQYKKVVVPITETGAFSFYPGKNLGCFGDGGALLTNKTTIAEKALLLRNDGSIKKYKHRLFGYKSRLDTIQAAVLLPKLTHLDQWNQLRRKHAQLYTKLLSSLEEIHTPQQLRYSYHVFHLYVIETPQRDALQLFLAKRGITTVIHYPTPIHLQLPYRKKGFKVGDFPFTERAAKRILSLPMFPELKQTEIQYVVLSIKEFFKKNLKKS